VSGFSWLIVFFPGETPEVTQAARAGKKELPRPGQKRGVRELARRRDHAILFSVVLSIFFF